MGIINKILIALLAVISILAGCTGDDDQSASPQDVQPEFGLMTDSRDGNEYITVRIGDQTWMAENMRYLPQVHQQNEYVGAFTEPRYFVYGYDGNNVSVAKQHSNYSTYGVLYNWSALVQGQGASNTNPSGIRGVCPENWHVPSRSEWQQLIDHLIAEGFNFDGSVENNKIAKSTASKEHWSTSSIEGTPGNLVSQNNITGLNILPAGQNTWPDFKDMGLSTWFWTSSEQDSEFAPKIVLHHDKPYLTVGASQGNKVTAISCRCLKD